MKRSVYFLLFLLTPNLISSLYFKDFESRELRVCYLQETIDLRDDLK